MKVTEDGVLSASRYAPLLRRLSKFTHPRRRRFWNQTTLPSIQPNAQSRTRHSWSLSPLWL